MPNTQMQREFDRMIGACVDVAMPRGDANHRPSVARNLALVLEISPTVTGQLLGLEWLGIEADVSIESERQQRAVVVKGEHPVEVVRAAGQVVAEQDGWKTFGIWHALKNRWRSGVAAGHVERR